MQKILIKGGRIIDGSGKRGFEGDVLISGDRIEFVGNADEKRAADAVVADAVEIDASGLVVAPGFIDIHAHADFALLQNGAASHKIMQGVTTEIVGNCGTGPAPANEAVKEYFESFLQ